MDLPPASENYFGQTTKQFIRQQWIKKQLKECKYQYTSPRHYNIFCGTWNVNGRARVDEEGLSDWLFPSANSNEQQDIFVIGYQEIVELTPMNVAVDPMGPQRTQFWLEQIEKCFQQHETASPSSASTSSATTSTSTSSTSSTSTSSTSGPIKYVNLCTKSLVGVLLCVYVKESLVPYISDLRWTTTAVGVMGVMGNKGGVVIRFNLHSTSICFVCAHLAASRNNIEARNSDYRNIMERSLLLPLAQNHLSSSSTSPSSTSSSDFSSPTLLEKCTSQSDGNTSYTILEHDLIFWIGDFNYRIDVSLSLEDIMELLQKENLHVLRKKDQLNLERAQGNVFQGFEEAVLTFPPTYKFQPNTDVYETRPEKKLRPPAWCDRILWRDRTPSGPEGKAAKKLKQQGERGSDDSMETKETHSSLGAIQNKNYLVSKLKPSDHKPVSASFSIETRVVNAEKEKLEYLRLVRQLDRMENEIQPKVEVGPLVDFNYHSIRFQERKHSVFFITNIGSANSLVNWRFVAKGDEVDFAEPWIHVEPSLGMISPGESIRVTVEVFIDYRSLDLISKKLGETDFIIHTKPSAEKGEDVQEESPSQQDSPSTSPSDVKRTNSDEEDKGLITEELLRREGTEQQGGEMISPVDMDGEDEELTLSSVPQPPPVTTLHLEDVLILKIENGRDYFLTVAADFAPTAEDINLMQLQKAQIEAIAAMEELRPQQHSHHPPTDSSAECESRQRRSSSSGLNKFFQEVKQSETKEKIIVESKNLASKIGSRLKSVKEKAAAAAAKLKDQNESHPTGGSRKGMQSFLTRRSSRSSADREAEDEGVEVPDRNISS